MENDLLSTIKQPILRWLYEHYFLPRKHFKQCKHCGRIFTFNDDRLKYKPWKFDPVCSECFIKRIVGEQ